MAGNSSALRDRLRTRSAPVAALLDRDEYTGYGTLVRARPGEENGPEREHVLAWRHYDAAAGVVGNRCGRGDERERVGREEAEE